MLEYLFLMPSTVQSPLQKKIIYRNAWALSLPSFISFFCYFVDMGKNGDISCNILCVNIMKPFCIFDYMILHFLANKPGYLNLALN